MATLSWQGGRDMGHLQKQVREQGQSIQANAIEALELSVEEGAVYTQDNLEAAVTKTGRARAAGTPMAFDEGGVDEVGGFPGRHDSGNMVGSVGHEVRAKRSPKAYGVFGWWGSNYEDYFRDQDLGEGNIPAARALPQAYNRARENFRRRLNDIIRNRPVS